MVTIILYIMLEYNNSARIGRNPSKCFTTQKAPTLNSALELTECGRKLTGILLWSNHTSVWLLNFTLTMGTNGQSLASLKSGIKNCFKLLHDDNNYHVPRLSIHVEQWCILWWYIWSMGHTEAPSLPWPQISSLNNVSSNILWPTFAIRKVTVAKYMIYRSPIPHVQLTPRESYPKMESSSGSQ